MFNLRIIEKISDLFDPPILNNFPGIGCEINSNNGLENSGFILGRKIIQHPELVKIFQHFIAVINECFIIEIYFSSHLSSWRIT